MTILLVNSVCALAQESQIQKGVFYLKIKEQTSELQKTKPFPIEELKGFISYQKVKTTTSNQRSKPSILDGLYKVQVNDKIAIQDLCAELGRNPEVIYAEPVYQEQLLYAPNDPDASNGNQSYLEVIKAFDAWEITKGNSDIVIGISDTGLDFEHTDIESKLFKNARDTINGKDDDGNGYVDDYQGYDFGDSDPISSPNDRKHGTMVGGLAGAATDNEFGIAGVGFNTTISSLKVFNSTNNLIINGYESVLYAADNGYDIINLSWGSPGTYSQAYEDIITYAAVEKNLIIIAAAGNTHGDLKFYPASYDHVISVSATNLQDQKASFATYNYSVDLVAPGDNIYSLALNNGFSRDNGTSYSAPMVAGAAALVKSVFPFYTGAQVGEQLRVTSDPIYTIGENNPYQYKLGYGRLNVYRAVTEENAKSIRLENVSYSNSFEKGAYPGDTLMFSFSVTNYLAPTNSSLRFSMASEYAEMLIEEMNIGALNTLDTSPVQLPLIRIADDTPAETDIVIKVEISDGDYTDFQYLELKTGPDRINLNNSAVELTVSGRGNLGFDKDNFFDGIGLRWNTTLMAARLGILIAEDESHVSDNLPKEPLGNTKEKDFTGVSPIRYNHSHVLDRKVSSSFTDDSITNPIDVQVQQNIMTNNGGNYLIQEYLINNSSTTSKTLNCGYFIDWRLPIEIRKNRSYYDPNLNALITYSVDSSWFTAVSTYFDKDPIYQALDIDSNESNTADISSLSDIDKYNLSSTLQFDSAGMAGNGNDIATLLTHNNIRIDPSYSKKSTFLIAFGNSLSEVRNNLHKADSSYSVYLNQPEVLTTVLACSGSPINIAPATGIVHRFYLDQLGEEFIHQGVNFDTGPITSDSAFYTTSIIDGVQGEIRKINVTLVDRIADFDISTDTLYLDASVNTVTFADQSFEPVSWFWDFDNGQQATIQNPSMVYNSPGTYQITLKVTSKSGCEETIIKTLVVAQRPEMPVIGNMNICRGEWITLSASNVDSIAVYAHELSKTPFTKGTSVPIGAIDRDTIFYVSHIDGNYESLKTAVFIDVIEVNTSFSIVPDTTRDEQTALLIIDIPAQKINWYVNNQLAGTNDTLALIANNTSYPIALKVTNSIGCSDSVFQEILFIPSPIPRISIDAICYGNNIKLAPTNGTYFGFYADPALSQLIKKGTTLEMKNIQDSLAVYIVGLDYVLPSSPLQVSIVPEKPNFIIEASPDSLYLSEQFTVALKSVGDDLISWRWLINNEQIETVSQPQLVLDSVGNYEIVLQGTNENGCQNTDTLNYLVYDQIIAETVLVAQKSQHKFFPNPARNHLYVKIEEPGSFALIDMSGKTVLQKEIIQSQQVDISPFPVGTYFIKFTSQGRVYSSRLLIQKK